MQPGLRKGVGAMGEMKKRNIKNKCAGKKNIHRKLLPRNCDGFCAMVVARIRVEAPTPRVGRRARKMVA